MDTATIDIAAEGDAVTLRLAGDFDLVSAPILRRALLDVLTRGVDVVVDCSAVTFVDITALNVLLAARQRATAQGRQLVITNPPCGMRRIAKLLALSFDQ